MGLCCYILEHVVFDFEFSRCVCIVSMLCLIFNFLGLCLILNFLGLCLIFNIFFWVCVWFLIFWVCLYCKYVVFDLEFSGCVCIVSMLYFILNFLGLCLILNFLDLCLILNFLYLNFEFSGEKKNTQIFFFWKTYSRVFSCLKMRLKASL